MIFSPVVNFGDQPLDSLFFMKLQTAQPLEEEMISTKVYYLGKLKILELSYKFVNKCLLLTILILMFTV